MTSAISLPLPAMPTAVVASPTADQKPKSGYDRANAPRTSAPFSYHSKPSHHLCKPSNRHAKQAGSDVTQVPTHTIRVKVITHTHAKAMSGMYHFRTLSWRDGRFSRASSLPYSNVNPSSFRSR